MRKIISAAALHFKVWQNKKRYKTRVRSGADQSVVSDTLFPGSEVKRSLFHMLYML